MLWVLHFVKKYEDFIAKHLDNHSHNLQRKLNLHVQCFNAVLFKKSMIKMRIGLYDKVTDQIKLSENFNSFKEGSKSFLLKHLFYSVDEFISF
jgi:hypothetical protein